VNFFNGIFKIVDFHYNFSNLNYISIQNFIMYHCQRVQFQISNGLNQIININQLLLNVELIKYTISLLYIRLE
jgi:hypothetical protein